MCSPDFHQRASDRHEDPADILSDGIETGEMFEDLRQSIVDLALAGGKLLQPRPKAMVAFLFDFDEGFQHDLADGMHLGYHRLDAEFRRLQRRQVSLRP